MSINHFNVDVYELLEEYKDFIELEEGELYSREKHGDDFSQWIENKGFCIIPIFDCDESDIDIPQLCEFLPVLACKALEKYIEPYLSEIYEYEQCFDIYTFEEYLDDNIDEPFDFRKITVDGLEFDYYYLVDEDGEEIED